MKDDMAICLEIYEGRNLQKIMKVGKILNL